ncbi:MAG TPA: glycosyltransferase family 4 protein [Usitatibacter sp.]|nr:glycosyltransferase family 4 protein [Usitatibacter sp.]
MPHRPLRILTWHVHGNYLYYLTQVPHEWYVISKPGHPPGYAGRSGELPWGRNVHDAPADQVGAMDFDCIVFQHRQHYLHDQHELLLEWQKDLPRIYLEHDPPQEHPTNTRHPVQDPEALIVHVTHFNDLMWDNGVTPTRVIEHGVLVPPQVRYTGEKEQGIVVVNNMRKRGRRLGADLYREARGAIPLALIGMDAEAEGGYGEVRNIDVPAFISKYRFFFHTCRYTSLGLAACEAMTIGMPIVAPATTEMVTIVRNGVNGYVDTNRSALYDAMRDLLRDPDLAKRWGDGARATALERFNIERFVRDWMQTLDWYVGEHAERRAA